MKTLIIVLLILTITLTAGYSYVKLFVQPPFGPVAILIVSVLGCLSLFFAITLFLYTRGKKKTVAKMWLFLIAAFMTYAIAELVSSSLFLQPLSPPMVRDQYRHHKFVPDTKTRFKSQEYDYVQSVNNVGLRGLDIQPGPIEAKFRILILGDSFTMGKGVEDDKTFSTLLERSLNADQDTFEVLNAGIDSYSPILSFFQLTKDLNPLEPDFIILNLDMSDLVQETAYRKKAIYGARGEIIGVDGRRDQTEKSFIMKVRGWIDQNLYITRMIFFYLEEGSILPEITVENVVNRANPETLKHTLADDTVNREEQWNNLFDSILKIKQYCDTNGIQFLLTVYPWGHQVNDKEWNPGRFVFLPKLFKVSDKSIDRIQKFSSNNNVELLNLFPAFRSYNGGSPLYYSEDMHWTEAGNKLMAQELEQHIRTRYLKTTLSDCQEEK